MMIFSRKMLLKLFFWTRTIELLQRRQVPIWKPRTFSSQNEKKSKYEKFSQKITFFTNMILRSQKCSFDIIADILLTKVTDFYFQSPDGRKNKETSQNDSLKKVNHAK